MELGFDSDTVKSSVVPPTFASLTATGSLIEIVGSLSSFVIVPTPIASEIVANDAPARFRLYVSSASSVVSWLTGTVTVMVVGPVAGSPVAGTNVAIPSPVVASLSTNVDEKSLSLVVAVLSETE